MTQQQPGVSLQAQVAFQPDGKAYIMFILPDGKQMITDGPPISPDKVGPLSVMFYPGQGVKIGLVEHGKGVHEIMLPLSSL